ncbi:hypothetical protein [Nafulsella turpanensis]|uniref:hypothetical protein n=1 Tax=Nafulsella turpanensis TaxID=1265690 RepID=UPI00036827DD|nr:hypothetical protein [Nafulsella turpanensis]
MYNVSANPGFLIAVEEMTRVMLYPCQLLVSTLLLMTLILSLMRGFTASGGVAVHYGFVARGFVLMGLLFFYQELLDLISGTIGAFAGYLQEPSNIYERLDELAAGRAAATDPTLSGYVEEVVQFFNSFNLLSLLQSIALGGIASIARKLMELFRQTLLGFLYITGPIAITLSVLPAFGQLLQKWFQHYLSVQCWSITLIILDNLVVLYRNLSQQRLGIMNGLSISEAAEKLDMLLITLVIALLYFMVPYLTSLFIGQTQSAVFPAKVLTAGAAATVLAAKGAAVVAGAGKGGLANGAAAIRDWGSSKGASGDREERKSGGATARPIPVRYR